MNRVCYVCKKRYSSPTRGWYDRYISPVCSSECFSHFCQSYKTYTPISEREDPEFARFQQSDRSFRSNYELEFNEWRWKRRGSLTMAYEPYVVTLRDKSRYVPDFLADGRVFIEVKGLWTAEGKKKFKAFTKEFEDIPIFVVDKQFLTMLKRTDK